MESELANALNRVQTKLARIRKIDANLTLFGAITHRYELGSPLTDIELEAYETRLGLRIPEGYREFLTMIGHGGAGPYYGLFCLDGSDSEDITDLKQVHKAFRWTEPLNPSKWENPLEQGDVWLDDDVCEGEKPRVFLNVPGALYICHYGCALRFFLIVNGVGVGQIWMDRQADDEGLIPECDEDGHKLSFTEWYERWLDDGIAEISRSTSATG